MPINASHRSFPEFVPHPLLRGPHRQTIFGSLASGPRVAYTATRYRIDLDDGDQVVLHDDCPAEWQNGSRVAILLHGISGSHASSYLVRMMAKLTAVGIRVFRLDMRGCGAGMDLAVGPAHAGRSEDVKAVLHRVAELCPDSPVTLVGYSMGGNIALKLLGETGCSPPGNLDRAIVIAPPIDLAACCKRLERGMNRIYQRTFVDRLVAQIRAKRPSCESIAAIPLHPRPRRVSEIDDRFTAPLSGFQGGQDYYQQCSAAPLLGSVKIPTLVITAMNDPLVPVELFEQYERSDAIQLHITPCGGHLGFYGISGIDPDRWWIDWRILDWLEPTEKQIPALGFATR